MCRIAAVLLAALSVAAGQAWASSTPYTPPEGGDKWQQVTVVLKGTSADKDAKGTAVLPCNIAETQHRIQLAAQNLVKEGVYSVWLVMFDAKRQKTVKQTRVDNPNRPLRADVFSNLAFAANLSACPQGAYNQVQVRYHADGNARSATKASTVLMGTIP